MTPETCPTCGSQVKIEGDTTRYFVPIADEEVAAQYALNVPWTSEDYGKRKQHYVDAFLAGLKYGRDQLAAIVERKDREISHLNQELITAKTGGRDALIKYMEKQNWALTQRAIKLEHALSEIVELGESHVRGESIVEFAEEALAEGK